MSGRLTAEPGGTIARGAFLRYAFEHVSEPTEERTSVLLYVLLLYVCVFWRGEAEQLA